MSLDTTAPPTGIEYPESDGQPMGDNTIQVRWIMKLFGGISGLFHHDPDVFAAANLFWYPIEGSPTTVTAPDVLVAFGRPKGDRRCYKQWEEGGVAPQVVMEVLSFSNTPGEMEEKFAFYDRYGVEEYYVYDPIAVTLEGFRRRRGSLTPIARMNGAISPRLGIRFDLSGPELQVHRPDGLPFVTYEELLDEKEKLGRELIAERKRAERERRRAEREGKRAERESRRADQANQRADREAMRADAERLARERLAAKIRELGIDPDSLSPGA